MILNFNVKIKSGKRLPIEVSCYHSAQEKSLEFQHSKKTISNLKIAHWIEKVIKEGLEKYKNQI